MIMGEEIIAYCVKCKKKQKMVMDKSKLVVSKIGMEMRKGPCIKCGCIMCRILGKAKAVKKGSKK
jgi:hypothetical protein